MRFKINLASAPYQNARRFFERWALGLTALLIVTGLLVFVAARSWRVNHALARSISEEHDRLDKLNDQEKADIAILEREQNRGVRDRSEALNALILRKSFSWTRIFNDFEKMMPARLHMVSITPHLTKDNQIEIRLLVAGESRDKAIELVQNMEKAPDFREPQITAENTVTEAQGKSEDRVTFNISALYVPAAAAAMSESEKSASAGPAQNAETVAGANEEKAKAKATSPARATSATKAKGGVR